MSRASFARRLSGASLASALAVGSLFSWTTANAQSPSAPACAQPGPCTPTATLDEYRHTPSGVRVYTLCAEEKALLSTLPSLFSRTGGSFPATQGEAAPAPLHRFFFRADSAGAVSRHFYTVLDEEIAMLNALPASTGGFTRCDEGSKGFLVKPKTPNSAAGIGGPDTYCPIATRPLWRILESNPVQHHLTDLYADVLSMPTGAVNEGVRACINDGAARVALTIDALPAVATGAEASTQIRVRSALAQTGLSPKAEAVITLPVALKFVRDSAGACRASDARTIRCQWTDFAHTRGDPMTLTLRRDATGSPTEQLVGNAWYPDAPTLTPSRAQADSFAVAACTAPGTPYYGCSVAAVNQIVPPSVGDPGMTLVDAQLYGPAVGASNTLSALASIKVSKDAGSTAPASPFAYLLARANNSTPWTRIASGGITFTGTDGAAKFQVDLPGPSGAYAICLSAVSLGAPETDCATNARAKINTPVPYSTNPSDGSVTVEVRSPALPLPDAVRGQPYPNTGPFECAWRGNVPVANPQCRVTNLFSGLVFVCSYDAGSSLVDRRFVCALAGSIPATLATGAKQISVIASATNDGGSAVSNFNITVR